MLKDAEHRHEEGDDRTRCPNCKVVAAAGRLSPFEAACWNWHCENVTGFSMESGIAAEEWRALRLRGPVRRAFLLGVSIIYNSEMERQRKLAESEHGKR